MWMFHCCFITCHVALKASKKTWQTQTCRSINWRKTRAQHERRSQNCISSILSLMANEAIPRSYLHGSGERVAKSSLQVWLQGTGGALSQLLGYALPQLRSARDIVGTPSGQWCFFWSPCPTATSGRSNLGHGTILGRHCESPWT